MKIVNAVLVLAAGLWSSVAAASADDLSGLFLTLEGNLAIHSSHMTESGNYPTGDITGPWATGGPAIATVYGRRLEAGFDFTTTQDAAVRLGLIYSSWGGSSGFSGNVAGVILGEPPPDGQKPEWEIDISDSAKTNHVAFSAAQSYWEIMPEVQFASGGFKQNNWQIGFRPFYGEIGEVSSSYYSNGHPQNNHGEAGINNSLSGQVLGAMVDVEKDFHLSKHVRAFATAGFGGYSVSSSATIIGVQNGVEIDRQSTIAGLRGQIEVGTDYDINSHVSLGTVARLDVWSAFPSISGKYGDFGGRPPCTRRSDGNLVCEPPRIVGAYDIISAPMTNLFVGASLTLRP